jgi:GNAT superfamily N-acetyltransferase
MSACVAVGLNTSKNLEIIEGNTLHPNDLKTEISRIAPGTSLIGIKTVLMAKIENKVVGFLMTRRHEKQLNESPTIEYLDTIQVEEGWRKKGIGTSLMFQAMRKAKEQGKTHLHVMVAAEVRISPEEREDCTQEEIDDYLKEHETSYRFFEGFNIKHGIVITLLRPTELNRRRFSNLLFDVQ